MCSESGSDASVDSEVSESTTDSDESTTELCEENDTSESTTELYEDGDTQEFGESTESLMEESDISKESELVGKESDKPSNENSQKTETTDDKDASESEADAETIGTEINEKSDYSDEVNEKISSVEELEVYQKANLKEENVDGRTCLVRDDIDMDYVDPKSGMTNQELMEKGRAPYDAKTGERIELHHIGQDYDSPLAELTENSEHGDYYSALHTKEGESWRNDSLKNNHYNNVERPDHWKSRVKGG